MSKSRWLRAIVYRLGQVREQLGPLAPLSTEERAEVERWLPVRAQELFNTMSVADQRHALRVCRGLQERGCVDEEMLAAALLHDVGKAEGRVPFWTRPTIVIGKRVTPGLLSRLTTYPVDGKGWRRSLSYAWYHADVGADLAAAVGLSPRAVLFIRTHHQPDGPAAQLHLVDEVS